MNVIRQSRGTDEELDRAIRSLKGIRVEMTDASRRHLALRCRESRSSAWRALAFRIAGSMVPRLPAVAGAMALFLACGLALLMVGHQTPDNAISYGESPVHLVKVIPAASGGVTLEWRDGEKRTYTVLKSSNPRNFKNAESYAVRGTRWTDDTPSPGQVVYYQVR